MSILEVIECIMEVEQLRKKAATESAAKDQETKTATKADDAKSSAESSEGRFVMVRKIADGIYEIAGVSEDDLNGLKAAAKEIVAREEQIRRRRRMVDESISALFAQEGFFGMMDFLAYLYSRPDYMDLTEFLRNGAQADQSKNDTDKS